MNNSLAGKVVKDRRSKKQDSKYSSMLYDSCTLGIRLLYDTVGKNKQHGHPGPLGFADTDISLLLGG